MRAPRLLLRLMGKAFALVALFAFMASTANAQTVCYVDTGGDDTFDGQTPATANRTIAACLGESYVDDGDIISIEAGTYSEGHVTVGEDLILEGRSTGSFTRVIVENGITVDADVTVRANTLGGGDAVFRLGDTNLTMALILDDGSLTIQNPVADGRVRIPDEGRVTRDDDTSVSGTITYLDTANVYYVDNDGSDTNISAGGELPSDFNRGDLNVMLGGNNTLTFASVTDLTDLDVGAGSILSGTVIIGDAILITGPGNAGTLDVNAGTVTFDANAAVQSVDIADNDAIVFDVNANTITINGNFVRLGGTFASDPGARFDFVGDDTDNTFTPGPNFAISTVTVDKDGQTLTITEDLDVTATGALAFMVASGSSASFADDQINVTSTGIVDIDGTVTNLSTIVFTAAGADMQGDGIYGDIRIATGGGDVTVGATTQEDVRFAGTLNLLSGGILVGGDDDLSPTGTSAMIIVNAARADTDIAGSFNDDDVDYDLEYTGDMAAGTKVAGTEFEAGDIRNLTFNVQDGTIDAVTNGVGGTISGNVALNDVGDAYTVNFPTPITIQGSLTVQRDATLNGTLLTLTGASNTVTGTISAGTTTTLDGTLTLTGSTDTNDPATVGPIVVANGENVTINNIQVIQGPLTTDADSQLSLTLAQEQDVNGNVALSGDMLTLGSDVDVNGNVDVNTGVLAFGANDLMVSGYFHGDADVDYTAAGGALVLDTANKTFGTTGETIPNVVLTGVIATQNSAVVIGNSLSETGTSTLDLAGNNLTISGSVVTDGGVTGVNPIIEDSGAGALLFNTTTITMSGDPEISDAFTIANNAILTLASNNATQRTLFADDGNLTIDGTLALGDQQLNLLDGWDIVNATGEVTSGDGLLILSGGTGVNPNDIQPNSNTLTIPDLSIVGVSTVGTTSNGSVQITDNLILNNTFSENDADDSIIIGDGATITVNSVNPLAAGDPVFNGLVSLIYNAAQTTGNEVPDNGALDNLTINVATVTFDQDATVNDVLTLNGTLATTSADEIITLADGATLRLQVDNANVPANRLAATNYTLEYEGPSDTISDIEFLTGATVTTLIIDPGTGDVITNSLTGAGAVRTVNNVLLDSGTLQLGGFGLNIGGDLTFDGGALINGTVPANDADVTLAFTGGADATVTLNGTYVVDDIDWTLNKTDNAVVNLAGPSGTMLDFLSSSTAADPEVLFLNGGIFQTEDDVSILLYQDANTQGFSRTVDEANDEESHIAGNVQKRLYQGDPFGTNPVTGASRSARFEFPSGPSATAETPDYRPFVLTFREQIVTQTDITVNHENENPQGTLGLPIASGDVLIGNYPDYFWLVEASTSLGQAQTFDVELTATDIGIPFTDDDDLRIIRRFDGDATTNEWNVQGSASNYDNFVSVDEDQDTTAVVRVLNSSGGLVPQGARFTLGLPTRPPLFTSADPGTLTVDEGEGVTFDFDADPQDLGETITFSLGENAPAFVTIDAQTGVLTAEPGFEDAGTYTFDVIASDGTATTTVAVTLIVNDVLEITPAQEDTTIADGETLTVDFDVSNPNPADPVTFGLGAEVENASIDATTGVFTFTPDFDQAGMVFDFVVFAKNASDSAGVAFSVTVEADILYGDANLSGDVTPLDASVVLQHAAGEITLTGKAATQADVSGTAGVTAFDAALILQFLTPDGDGTLLDCFPADPTCEVAAKMGMVAFGDPQWGDVTVDAVTNTITLPIALDGNVDNVYAINFTADVDVELVNFKQVTGMLPDDWMVKSFFDKKAGKLTIAMAGATPLSDAGVIAKATFEQLDSESKPVFRAQGFVNENASVEFGEIKAEQLPTEFALGDNYPNPFNPSTAITYALPQKAQVTLEIYDVAGRLVQTLVNQEREAGRYTIQWNGQNAAGSQVASGLYVYRIKAGSFVEAKTMMLVK